MTARALLAGAGALLFASLFLPWFDGVSGWEHWAWADVPLAALAVALTALAVRPSLSPLRIAVVVLCGLGIAVVFGHGFEPRVDVRQLSEIGFGGLVAMLALTAGVIGALAWPVGGSVLLVAAAGGLVAALFSAWGVVGDYPLVVDTPEHHAAEKYPNGFERWRALDIGLLVLAAGLLAAAARPLPRVAVAVLAAASVAAGACVVVGSIERTQWMVGDGGVVEGAPLGALAALLSLLGAVAGLALVRPRAPAARAG